jgi:Pyruvate/2-oxoacid:ferredoxin oxidoreductase gamma subunit
MVLKGERKESKNLRTENTVFLGCLLALEIFNVQEKDIRESISAVVSSKIIEHNQESI